MHPPPLFVFLCAFRVFEGGSELVVRCRRRFHVWGSGGEVVLVVGASDTLVTRLRPVCSGGGLVVGAGDGLRVCSQW